MKKYVKPMVEVVNLKSSNDIATTFDGLRDSFVRNYLKDENSSGNYMVSVYSNTVSNGQGGEELLES